MTDGEFHKVAETVVHRGYVMRVAESSFEGPAGERFSRDVIYMPGAVAVVPLDTRPAVAEIVFVRQFRGPIESMLLEIPAGMRDVEGEAPELTAVRELSEEVGLAAGRVELLGGFLAAAGMTDHRTELFLALDLEDVESAREGVEEDYMTVERHTIDVAWEMILDGRIIDAKTIVGITLTREWLSRHGGGAR